MIKNAKIKKWFLDKKEREIYRVTAIFDVEYAHLKLKNEDDFFISAFGLSMLGDLNPADFQAESQWFKNNSERLSGTSCVYKVRTKKINGRNRDLVIKWNRMGEDVPGAVDYDELIYAEFNSPFEEFSLVKDLRNIFRKSSEGIVLQKPLAIYVPSKRYKLWQTGRSQDKMKSMMHFHSEIDLDMNRLYMVIYEWLPGMDAAQAYEKGLLDDAQVRALTQDAADRLAKNGFVVSDNKPNHIIVQADGEQSLKKDDAGRIQYALIDYELLGYSEKQKKLRHRDLRKDYHRRQKDRFSIATPDKFHPHLEHMKLFGVDYVYGRVESTKGRLWVAGKDPYLFDYFQPERWEGTKRTKISMFSESYYTVTKDNIHIVWEVSKVGLIPDMDPFLEDEKKILDHGYNSPFEEIGLAIALTQKGIATIYPRAIYMTGHKTEIIERFFDNSRYASHAGILSPDKTPVLKKNRNYIIIWGYWNGPDEKLAEKDGDYYEGINALYAFREGIISRDEYMRVVMQMKEQLMRNGIEDLNLSGKHLLISVNSRKEIVRDAAGTPDIRICNFEFFKKLNSNQRIVSPPTG